MGLIAVRAPGERGIHHYVDEWSYLGGGMTRARCGLRWSTWLVALEKNAQDCLLCVMEIEQEERMRRQRGVDGD